MAGGKMCAGSKHYVWWKWALRYFWHNLKERIFVPVFLYSPPSNTVVKRNIDFGLEDHQATRLAGLFVYYRIHGQRKRSGLQTRFHASKVIISRTFVGERFQVVFALPPSFSSFFPFFLFTATYTHWLTVHTCLETAYVWQQILLRSNVQQATRGITKRT